MLVSLKVHIHFWGCEEEIDHKQHIAYLLIDQMERPVLVDEVTIYPSPTFPPQFKPPVPLKSFNRMVEKWEL